MGSIKRMRNASQLTHYLTLAVTLTLSSFNVYAEPAAKPAPPASKQQIKKSPEAYFTDGLSCLKQAQIACAKLAAANIPSASAYAKLLQGSIALTENQTDKAMLLLLPLQTDTALNTEAKIALHQQLANTFKNLDDTQQALQHLMLAESAMASLTAGDKDAGIDANHQKIWALLNGLDQNQLITMRGENTDNHFQGWVDLCLAARNQDSSTSIKNWSSSYSDHPASGFAKNLATANSAQAHAEIRLPTDGAIALILPLANDIDSSKADAFMQGLAAALARNNLKNEIKAYPSAASEEDISEIQTVAKNEDNAYFIIADFNAAHTPAAPGQQGNGSILHVGLFLDDEAQRIASFASANGIQRIAIVTSENETAKLMTTSFKKAWKELPGLAAAGDSVNVITLPGNISANSAELLDLKSKIAGKPHDMVLLATTAAEARMIRPYLDISTPTMTFSCINENLAQSPADPALNALRFVDIPFLLKNNQGTTDYSPAEAGLGSNELLRWYALGVDSLQLLVASQRSAGSDVIINGLTGTLAIDKSGNMKRQLSVGKFTYNGVVAE